MFSPSTCFRRLPDLRLRPIPEWQALIVYTPQRPDLHWLNPEAWMVLELANGEVTQIADAYAREAGIDDAEEAYRIVDSCLQTLERKGIVERVQVSDGQPADSRTERG